MTEVITYSLRDGQKHSDQYYEDVAVFTEEVLGEVEGRAQRLVEAFREHTRQTGGETPRSRAEYAFEILVLGVLWRTYAGQAARQGGSRLLAGLARLRQSNAFLKPGIDILRGVLGAVFLHTKREGGAKAPEARLDNLERLMEWMEATGDFNEEVKRLRGWRDFLSGQRPDQVSGHLNTAISLAAWFEGRSREALGRYTPNVEAFLAHTHPGYRWREDAIFCGRQRVEYHLNMVGTEVLNRAFREEFLRTERKAVLLPPCMRAKPEGQCQARMTPFGERCAGCTPGCRVHQATKLGEKHGFDVFIMPHELSVFSSGKVKPAEIGSVGVVGVSCPLTNVTGGWETKDLGVPAQGVLLDYCGCPWHWHKEGIPTDISFHQLLKVLGSEDGDMGGAEAILSIERD